MSLNKLLDELNLSLPKPVAPVANYVPVQRLGNSLIISGQLPFLGDGSILNPGIVGKSVATDDAVKAAELCALHIVSQALNAVNGDESKIKQIVRLGGFVASTPDFEDHPKVINGASDLMVKLFGEKGKHARAAVGVASLPKGACVEVEATIEIT